jgi:hypothetical protein
MADSPVDDALKQLDKAGGRIRCSELCELLEGLGFYFKSKKTPGHKVYFHDGLTDFFSGSFNCDHAKDPSVKAGYIQRVRSVLTEFKDALDNLPKGNAK